MNFSNKYRVFVFGVMLIFLSFTQTYSQIKIMPLGDSITKGTGSSHEAGYRKDLKTALEEVGITTNFVGSQASGTVSNNDNQHEGHEGFTSVDLNLAVDGYLDSYNPDYVLIMIGSNDISDIITGTKSVENTIANINGIVDKIHNHNGNIQILISSLSPRTDSPADSIGRVISKHIKILYEVKKQQGYEIIYVGNNELLTSNANWATDYMTDYLHPDDDGYYLMAKAFYHAIHNVFNHVMWNSPNVTDNFDRSILNDMWHNEGGEFNIVKEDVSKITYKELHNSATDGSWSHLAIFKSASNPSAISFKWGHAVTADGMVGTGVAIMLHQVNLVTRGYIIRFKKEGNLDYLNLWMIKDGYPREQIDETPNLVAAPVAGNDCKIVMSSDGNSHKFDCYIRGEYAGTLEDPEKSYGNLSKDLTDLYSGFMLKGSISNNIDNFDLFLLGDTTRPAVIADLNSISATSSSITLSWTAPGDDGTQGRASHYEIRYSKSQITGTNWHLAIPAKGVGKPNNPGTMDNFVFAGLESNTTYYFAIKTADEMYNWSKLSNVKQATTSSGGGALLKTDEFNNLQTFQTNWSAHPAYTVANGQLVNSTGTGWEALAVFKMTVNPEEASLVWAASPGSDLAGIDKGGLAILLDNQVYSSANGYLCTIRTLSGADPNLYLFTIVNGQAQSVISSYKVVGSAKPQPGDVFKVVVSTDIGGHNFDFYLNEIFYGRLIDPNKTYSNGTDSYSGIMLHGGLINNVEKFSVLSKPGEPKYLEKVSPLVDPTGIVGSVLADSLVIRVLDNNFNPVSNLVVDFSISQGNGKLDITPKDENIRIEAENTNVEGQMQLGIDANAGGGKYVYTDTNERFKGKIEFNIYVKTAGKYLMFGRTMVFDKIQHSLFVQIDDQPNITADTVSYAPGSWPIDKTIGQWIWDSVSEGSGSGYKEFNLSAGIHKVTVTQRYHEGAGRLQIDKFLFTRNFQFWPAGKEEVPQYLTDNNGLARAQLILDTVAGTNGVQASVPGYSMTPGNLTFLITGVPDIPVTMVATSATTQTGKGGEQLPNPFEVQLKDKYNNLASGYTINFNVTEGGGTLSNGQTTHNVVTDALGKAATFLTLGTEAVTNKVRASYSTLTPVTFTATATSGLAERIKKITTGDLSGIVNTTLATPLKVQVVDNLNSPVRHHKVNFKIVEGGGSLSPATAANNGFTESKEDDDSPVDEAVALATEMDVYTDNDGYAQVRLQLGTTAGRNKVVATAKKSGQLIPDSPIEFIATGTPDVATTLNKIEGYPTNGAAGMPLSGPFIVQVSDQYGNGIAGHSVTFTIKQGAGSLNPAGPWLTEAGGRASVVLTLGTQSGVTNVVEASASGIAVTVTFSAMAGTVSALQQISALTQTGSSGLPLADSLKVKVVDNFNNPVGGYQVKWTCIGSNKGTVNGAAQATVKSDNYGISQVRFVGGSIPGLPSQVEARADGLTGSPYTFTINMADVDGIQPVDGNNQIGTVGTPLDKPFKVEVVDNLGNAIPGYKVTYQVKSGGGSFNGATTIDVPTNENYEASATLTLGPKPGNKNNVVEIIAKQKGLELLQNGSLNNWNGANLVDWGIVTYNPGNSITRDSLNARSGSCVKIRTTTSTYANIYNTNNIPLKPNSLYEFSIWAKGAYGGEKLLAFIKYSDNYSLLPDGTWGPSGNSWLDIQTLTTAYTRYTIQFTTLSNMTAFVGGNISIYGKDNNLIYIDDISLIEKGADGEMYLNGSPLIFTASANIGAPDSLTYVSGDSQYVVVGNQLENPLVIKVADKCSNPIKSHSVVFEVKAGGGYLDGNKNLTTVTKTTNDSGRVQATYNVGITKGDYNNIIEARANKTGGGSLRNSPYRFYASARSSPADSLKRIAGDNQPNCVVRQKMSQPFTVQVRDSKGNGVEGHPVTFTAIIGNGTFDSLEGDSTVQKVTNNDGYASVYYYPGPKAGEMNVVFATSKNGVHDLKGVPVDFKVTPIRGAVSATKSQIRATGPIPADNLTSSIVTVTLTDDWGNPISGKAVIMNVTGSNNQINQPSSLTNENGITTGSFVSSRAELKKVSAYDVSDGVQLINAASVRFTNLAAVSLNRVDGSEQQGNFGTALKYPVRAVVTDRNGNPVYRHQVFFEVTEGDGLIYTAGKQLLRDGESVLTDSSGIAAAYWILGPSAQVQWAKAYATGLSGEAKYLATARQGQPATLVKVSGDNQTGISGYTLDEQLVVKVTDNNGNPIKDYQVRFRVTYGGGSFNNINTVTLPSDPFGEASVYYTISREAGINQVEALASGLPLNSIQYFTATGISGAAAKIAKAGGEGNTGQAGGTLSGITVRITDIFDNIYRDGYNVQFGVESGNATIIGNPIITTGSDGTASVPLQLGTQIGKIVVSAFASGLINSPLKFNVYAVAATPVKMSIHSGNNQSGTIGRELVYPLKVIVEDTYNNPASNVAISFVASGGGMGTLLTSQLLYTDEDGIAASRLKLGSTTGSYRVKAINNSLIGNGLEFVLNGVTNNFPVFVNLEKEVTREETQTLTFAVNATDDDNDYALSYQASNLPPGATFDALNTRRFTWTPGYLDAGAYEVHFIVRDSQGGLDDEAVKINITNRNRPPTIVSATPMQNLIVGHRDIGETVTFSIGISDQDSDDAITYKWFFNNILVASTQNYSIYVNDAMVDLGSHTIKVVASDGFDTVERSWTLTVKTPVELSTFTAEVVPREGVRLNWETRLEVNHAGFNILRSQSINGNYKRMNKELILPTESKKYQFLDSAIKVGEIYFYKLEDVSISGTKTEHGAIKVFVAKPEKFELSQNYPNPFNPTTRINYQLPDPAPVKLTIFNLLGQEIVTLVDQQTEAGYHTVIWNGLDKNGSQVTSGIYYYRIIASDFIQAKKMVLIK